MCQNGQQFETEQIVCSSNGQWKMINGSNYCSAVPGIHICISGIAEQLIIFHYLFLAD